MNRLSRLSPSQFAGTLSLVNAAGIFGIWCIFLFWRAPELAVAQISFVFSPNTPHREFFAWLAILPIAYILIGFSYLRSAARTSRIAVALLATLFLCATGDMAFKSWDLALIGLLPAYWGWKEMMRAVA